MRWHMTWASYSVVGNTTEKFGAGPISAADLRTHLWADGKLPIWRNCFRASHFSPIPSAVLATHSCLYKKLPALYPLPLTSSHFGSHSPMICHTYIWLRGHKTISSPPNAFVSCLSKWHIHHERPCFIPRSIVFLFTLRLLYTTSSTAYTTYGTCCHCKLSSTIGPKHVSSETDREQAIDDRTIYAIFAHLLE